MPSGLTHMLLIKYSKNEYAKNPDAMFEDIRNILDPMLGPMLAGSIAPDLPYTDDAFFSTKKKLADKFHYEMTNEIPLNALNKIKMIPKPSNDKEALIKNSLFCFYLGYISHIIADGVMHPYVRDKVGDYSKNKTAHRVLEMRLDVLSCDYLVGTNLNQTKLYEDLELFNDKTNSVDVLNDFSEFIKAIYKYRIKGSAIQSWINNMKWLLEKASGNFPQWYKNLSIYDSISYRDYNELVSKKDELLILTKPVDAEEKQLISNFANKDKVDFINDCIPQFNKKFISVLKKSYNYIYNDGLPLDAKDIPAIDLDTGRLIIAPDLKNMPELWRN